MMKRYDNEDGDMVCCDVGGESLRDTLIRSLGADNDWEWTQRSACGDTWGYYRRLHGEMLFEIDVGNYNCAFVYVKHEEKSELDTLRDARFMGLENYRNMKIGNDLWGYYVQVASFNYQWWDPFNKMNRAVRKMMNRTL